MKQQQHVPFEDEENTVKFSWKPQKSQSITEQSCVMAEMTQLKELYLSLNSTMTQVIDEVQRLGQELQYVKQPRFDPPPKEQPTVVHGTIQVDIIQGLEDLRFSIQEGMKNVPIINNNLPEAQVYVNNQVQSPYVYNDIHLPKADPATIINNLPQPQILNTIQVQSPEIQNIIQVQSPTVNNTVEVPQVFNTIQVQTPAIHNNVNPTPIEIKQPQIINNFAPTNQIKLNPIINVPRDIIKQIIEAIGQMKKQIKVSPIINVPKTILNKREKDKAFEIKRQYTLNLLSDQQIKNCPRKRQSYCQTNWIIATDTVKQKPQINIVFKPKIFNKERRRKIIVQPVFQNKNIIQNDKPTVIIEKSTPPNIFVRNVQPKVLVHNPEVIVKIPQPTATPSPQIIFKPTFKPHFRPQNNLNIKPKIQIQSKMISKQKTLPKRRQYRNRNPNFKERKVRYVEKVTDSEHKQDLMTKDATRVTKNDPEQDQPGKNQQQLSKQERRNLIDEVKKQTDLIRRKYGTAIQKEALEGVIEEIQKGNITRRECYALIDSFNFLNFPSDEDDNYEHDFCGEEDQNQESSSEEVEI